MNRKLMDPISAIESPSAIEEYLERGTAVCLAFNRRGTLLAAGTADGQVVLWDYETRGEARTLAGHSKEVTSVSWSRNGRYLLSGSADSSVSLWDVLQGTQEAQQSQPSPVLHVCLSARPPYQALVSLTEGPPQLLDLQTDSARSLPIAGEPDASSSGRSTPPGAIIGSSGGGSPAVAIFSKHSDLIYMALGKGLLSVVDAKTLETLDVVRVPSTARLMQLQLNRSNSLLIVNCGDRVIRMYDVLPRSSIQKDSLPKGADALRTAMQAAKGIKSGSLLHGGPAAGLLRPVRDFQEAVARLSWAHATFSRDSEWVVGCATSQTKHTLVLWSRLFGNIDQVLEGPKESILCAAWHPLNPEIASISGSGRIYLWAPTRTENWSAYAPGFEELDQNTEHVEQEDEFDWATPGASGDLTAGTGASTIVANGVAHSAAAADIPIDIVSRRWEQVVSSDEEAEADDQLYYLPAEVETDAAASMAAAQEEEEYEERQAEDQIMEDEPSVDPMGQATAALPTDDSMPDQHGGASQHGDILNGSEAGHDITLQAAQREGYQEASRQRPAEAEAAAAALLRGGGTTSGSGCDGDGGLVSGRRSTAQLEPAPGSTAHPSPPPLPHHPQQHQLPHHSGLPNGTVHGRSGPHSASTAAWLTASDPPMAAAHSPAPVAATTAELPAQPAWSASASTPPPMLVAAAAPAAAAAAAAAPRPTVPAAAAAAARPPPAPAAAAAGAAALPNSAAVAAAAQAAAAYPMYPGYGAMPFFPPGSAPVPMAMQGMPGIWPSAVPLQGMQAMPGMPTAMPGMFPGIYPYSYGAPGMMGTPLAPMSEEQFRAAAAAIQAGAPPPPMPGAVMPLAVRPPGAAVAAAAPPARPLPSPATVKSEGAPS